eukprot:11165508-Lingulodinium_polyedra.AAC.1
MSASSSQPLKHPAVERIHGLSRGSQCLTTAGSRELDICCEAAKEVLGVAWQDTLKENQGQPLLTSKSCDGTPMNTRRATAVKMPSGAMVRASGRASAEYLVKLQWLRSLRVDGSHQTIVLLQEATP